MDKNTLDLAKIGLRALIDEATGYQKKRSFNDLRQYARKLKTTEEINAFIEKETGKQIKVKKMDAFPIVVRDADKIIDAALKKKIIK